MKRFFLLLCALLLAASAALADPLPLADDLHGEYALDGVDYLFSITLPQIAGDTDVAETINNVYAMEMSEQLEFKAPIKAEVFGAEGMTGSTVVTYEITRNDDQYFCAVVTSTEMENGQQFVIRSAHVFPIQGSRGGLVASLPYLLGLLESGESDTWLQDRQTAKADACVRQMVWEQLEKDMASGKLTCFDYVDYEYFEGCFYPEEDFYMEADGTLVFFMQAGFIADAKTGILEWRFTIDDLLDEI